jgi:mRNA-degrading endonuclease toxin of MazEF toxin-antitoxin module
VAYVGPVRRWDTFWADLEPGVGREQRGESRPVLVLSNDGFNAAFDVVTILPLTKLEGKKRDVYPFEVLLEKGTVTDAWSSIVMPQQIRTISKLRLLNLIGRLTDDAIQTAIENRVLEHLGIAFEAEAE